MTVIFRLTIELMHWPLVMALHSWLSISVVTHTFSHLSGMDTLR